MLKGSDADYEAKTRITEPMVGGLLSALALIFIFSTVPATCSEKLLA